MPARNGWGNLGYERCLRLLGRPQSSLVWSLCRPCVAAIASHASSPPRTPIGGSANTFPESLSVAVRWSWTTQCPNSKCVWDTLVRTFPALSWMYRPCVWCRSGTTDASCALCRKNEVTTIDRAPPFTLKLHFYAIVCGILRRRLARDKYRLFLMLLRLARWSMLHSSSKSTLRNTSLKVRFMGRIDWFFVISLARCVNNLTFARATVVNKMITFCYGCYAAIGDLLSLPIYISCHFCWCWWIASGHAAAETGHHGSTAQS